MKTSTFSTFSIRLDETTAANLAELAARDERKRGDWLKRMIRHEAAKMQTNRKGQQEIVSNAKA